MSNTTFENWQMIANKKHIEAGFKNGRTIHYNLKIYIRLTFMIQYFLILKIINRNIKNSSYS